ncbi:MAG: carboxymuconolactone decarboxylase family protein [bacterium]|jgi:AhpD family alkylhydroperoxidase
MPRIEPLPLKTEDAEVRAVFDDFLRERGNVPNLFRTFARRLEMMTTSFAHFRAVTYTGTVPVEEKELAAVRTSQINSCRYCMASHIMLAKKFGMSREKFERLGLLDASAAATEAIGDGAPSLAEVLGPEGDTVWSARERAVLKIADALTRNAAGLPDEIWNEARAVYAEEEVMEIIAIVCQFNYYNRFANALEIEITK